MNLLEIMRGPLTPNPMASVPRPALPSAPRPAAPAMRYVPPPLCHAWGAHGDIHGTVQRDKTGLCVSFVVNHLNGDRERFEAERMSPNVARELAVRLTQHADAWDREFGGGVQS